MSQEEINILREQSGLNKPFLIQYVDWLRTNIKRELRALTSNS